MKRARHTTSDSGLKPFKGVLRDVKELWTWVVGAAVAPFILHIASAAPPWPSANAITLFTAIIGLLAFIVAFEFFKTSPARIIKRVLAVGLVVLLIVSVLYLVMLSQLTFKIPVAGTRDVMGLVCTPNATVAFGAKCPWLGEVELKQAEWTASHLWTSWSITVSRVILVILWLAAFVMLSLVLGTFVVHQRRRLRHSART